MRKYPLTYGESLLYAFHYEKNSGLNGSLLIFFDLKQDLYYPSKAIFPSCFLSLSLVKLKLLAIISINFI